MGKKDFSSVYILYLNLENLSLKTCEFLHYFLHTFLGAVDLLVDKSFLKSFEVNRHAEIHQLKH